MAGRDPYDDELRDAPLHVLLAALKTGSTDRRYVATDRLYERAVLHLLTYPPLLEAAARGPRHVATHALEAIAPGWDGEARKQIVDGLRFLARSQDPLVRLGATMAIWRTTGAAQAAVRELRRALRSTDEQVLVFAVADCWVLGRAARALAGALRRLAERSGPDRLPSIAAALFKVGAGVRIAARLLAPMLKGGTYEQQGAALGQLCPMPEVARALSRPIADIAEGRTMAPESLRQGARQVQLYVRGLTSRRPRRGT